MIGIVPIINIFCLGYEGVTRAYNEGGIIPLKCLGFPLCSVRSTVPIWSEFFLKDDYNFLKWYVMLTLQLYQFLSTPCVKATKG